MAKGQELVRREYGSSEEQTLTYDDIFFSLREAGQRYSAFAQFRVIGKSHDERLIPMLEIGGGEECIFCLGGLDGRDQLLPGYLTKAAEEYCRYYENRWDMGEGFAVRKLLDRVRICMIPLLNPDGYEVCANGYRAVRNPIYRQMLRMQGTEPQDFEKNARGICLEENFPTDYYKRYRIHQEPESENETRALIRIIQEYTGCALLSFKESRKKLIRCQQSGAKGTGGTPEQFYADRLRRPSFRVQIPMWEEEKGFRYSEEKCREISLFPLEYLALADTVLFAGRLCYN